MVFEEKTINSEHVFKDKLINVKRDIVTTVNGESVRELVEHRDGAVIMALKPDGKLIMERQFRKPVETVVFEAPAGKIDEGETPEEAALRELKEETGYTAGAIRLLTSMWPSVGFLDEKLYIYLCTNLEAGETELDENEAIDIEEHHVDDLFDMVLFGKITDAKTQIGVFMVKALIDKGELGAEIGRASCRERV